MENSLSKKFKNKWKFLVFMCVCLIAATSYAMKSPPNLENQITEFSSIGQTNPIDLAKAKNCLSCHSVDSKIVGPAYKDVGRKYAGQKDAQTKLTSKVMKGGSGTWGKVSMPSNKQITENEAQTLVKWILTLK